MKDRHDQLIAALGDFTADDSGFTVGWNPTEYDHPESLITHKGETDQNIEVIYLDDVVLLQENGDGGKGHTAFVWATNANWPTEAAIIITEWLI
jgi:hypothetical protein